jgi:translation initiation factor eIF-2B subunit epsilon
MSSCQGERVCGHADLRTTALHGPLLVGPRSTLSHNTLIHQSTLGADCSIGHDTTVSLSYVFADVRIGSDCILEECIVGDGVVIGDNVRVGKGVLLGNGVKLGDGVTVPDFARVGKEPYRADDYDSDEEEDEDEAEIGESRPGHG